MSEAVVIAHIEAGEITPTFHVVGAGVRVFVVDDNAPQDRVYEMLNREDPSVIRELIPEDAVIGSNRDERHEAISNRVLAELDGRPRLSVVKDPQT